MAEQLGINESAVKKHLNHLKDAGWLERVGGTRGYWAIKKEFGGDVSDGWFKTTVGEYSPFVYGKAIKKDDQRTMGIPVYGSNGLCCIKTLKIELS